MADKIFWLEKIPSRESLEQLSLSRVDIYHLCSAAPESHAERLYDATKNFLEDHCQSIIKVVVDSR